jgi:hypothetical protein
VKLQDAYASESNALGNWAAIGYVKPGGTNFSYSGNDPTVTCADDSKLKDGKCVNKEDEAKAGNATGAAVTKGWAAANKVVLNECAASTDEAPNWQLDATIGLAAATNAAVTYTNTVNTNCSGLTPNFGNIGK